jgi:hypothetical protein
MARTIDWSQELSEEEVQYLVQRPWLAQQARVQGHELPDLYYELSKTKAPAHTQPQPLVDLDDQEPDPTGPNLDAEDEEEDDEVAYGDLTVEQLKEELHTRELPVSGNKDELIARLEADDEEADGLEEDE